MARSMFSGSGNTITIILISSPASFWQSIWNLLKWKSKIDVEPSTRNSVPMPFELPDASIIREAAHRALGEDRGPVDLTTQALIAPQRTGEARIFSKESGVLCGLPVAIAVFRELDPKLNCQALMEDGVPVKPGDTVMHIAGPLAPILTGERSALNFLQQLSGVATRTRAFVDATGGAARILDTRKTIPGLRALQKYAVRCGGGTSHRMGLYDAFMMKDNHVAFMSGDAGLAQAVEAARSLDPDAPIIFEADSLDQVRVLLELNVDRILLDNMSCAEMSEAVHLSGGRIPLEASGNMTLERIPDVAATGVDFISVGALTHSITSLDFSLEVNAGAKT